MQSEITKYICNNEFAKMPRQALSPASKKASLQAARAKYRSKMKRSSGRIRLQETTVELWTMLREELQMKSNDDVAKYLLTLHEDQKDCINAAQVENSGGETNPRKGPLLTSSPAKKMHQQTDHDIASDAPSLPSSISSLKSASNVGLATPSIGDGRDSSTSHPDFDISVSFALKGDFLYPNDKLSEVDEGEFSEAEATTFLQFGPSCDNLDKVGEEEDVIGMEAEEAVEEETEETSRTKSGLHQKSNAQEAQDAEYYLVSKSRLLDLASKNVGNCSRCGSQIKATVKHGRGSAAHVTWTCTAGHTSSWCTQETLNGTHVGDLKMAAAILFSGNNFRKIKLLSKMLSLHMMDKSTFYAMQRRYLCPAVEDQWQEVQAATVARHRGEPVVLCGDGRNDSPGHNAQYLTYIFIEHDTQDVVHVIFKDKRQCDMVSVRMEPQAFKEGLVEVEQLGVEVKEVVTDAHSSIAKFMRENRPNVKHSWDIWHGAKNLGKRLTKASTRAANRALVFWIKHILLHFWFCARTCEGSVRDLTAKWRSLTHHVTNKHTWTSGMGRDAKCEHGPLEDREEWLTNGSSPHRRMVEVVYDKKFLSNLDYYTNFRHTSMLESINNHILMYASKRFAFNYQAYRARNLLAMIDYMAHKDRGDQMDADGNVKYVGVWSKHAGNYVAKRLKVAKTYAHIPDLMARVFSARESDDKPLFAKAERLPEDPFHIRPRLPHFPAPPIEEILARRKGRLATDN